MTVLVVINSLITGGKERRMLELVKNLKNDYKVNFLILALNSDVRQKQVYDYGIRLFTCKKSFMSRITAAFTIISLCKKYNPDIINSWCSLSTLLCIPAKILLVKPLVNNQITSAHLEHRRLSIGNLVNRLNFIMSNLVIANSEAGLKAFNPPNDKSLCIHNGFDLLRTQKVKEPVDEIRARFSVKTPILLTMMGSMHGKKDYNTFLESAIAVCRQRQDVTFMGVGGGPYLNCFVERVPKDLANRIIFPGERDDIDDIVYASDIGILATYSEGISNGLMEFMAFGKPVVTSRVGGTPELVRDGVDGLLVKPRSVDDLTDKVLFILDNQGLIAEMGSAGRDRIHSSYNMGKQSSQYYLNFTMLLQGRA